MERKTFGSMKEARAELEEALGYVKDCEITLDEPLSLIYPDTFKSSGTHFAQLIVKAANGETVISMSIAESLLEHGFVLYNVRYTRKDGLYLLGSAYISKDAKHEEEKGARPSSAKEVA
jgi:hypothetical protein